MVLLYTFILLAACLLPFIYGMSSWLYLAAAVILNAGFFCMPGGCGVITRTCWRAKPSAFH